MSALPKLTAGLAALEWAAQYDELTTERVVGPTVTGAWLRVTFPDGAISYFQDRAIDPISSVLSANTIGAPSETPETLLERAARVVEVYRALEARAATVRPCDCGGVIHGDSKGRYDKACSDCIEASERDNAERRKQGGENWREREEIR